MNEHETLKCYTISKTNSKPCAFRIIARADTLLTTNAENRQ